MPDETKSTRGMPRGLTILAGVMGAFLLAAGVYVCYQASQILFPQN